MKKKKIPVEVYSRVVGYFRPVNQWNNGKREEFSERKHFVVKNKQLVYEYKRNTENLAY